MKIVLNVKQKMCIIYFFSCRYTVEWGDGTSDSDEFNSAEYPEGIDFLAINHVYGSTGYYQVTATYCSSGSNTVNNAYSSFSCCANMAGRVYAY